MWFRDLFPPNPIYFLFLIEIKKKIYFFEKIVYPFNRSARTPSICWDSLLASELRRPPMERLLQPPSSSSSPKFPSRASPFLPRLRSPSLGFLSSPRPESRRVSSISCGSFQNQSGYTTHKGSDRALNSLNGPPPYSGESKPNPGSLQRIVGAAVSEKRKVFTFFKTFNSDFRVYGVWSDSLDRNWNLSFRYKIPRIFLKLQSLLGSKNYGIRF